MFVTTRESGVRRRNRVYGNIKGARSSKLSLLSTFTVSTTGSGGSNSTVTQESYNRSQQKSRRRRPREHRSRKLQSDDLDTSVDVFDYLVNDPSKSQELLPDVVDADTSDTEDDYEDQTRSVDNKTASQTNEPEPEVYYRSMSDSGISMGSGSSVSNLPPKGQLPVVFEEPLSRPSSRGCTGNELAIIDPRWHWPNTSPFPDHYPPPPVPHPPPAVVYDVPMYPPHPYPPYTPYGTPPPLPEEDLQGPRLTIREPSGQSTKLRCFRSFSRLSSRLVIQMQDDLAYLEDELRQVDKEEDIALETGETHGSFSSNRRRERRLKEEDIYRDIHVKLDQYYHAVEMMQKVEDLSEPALTSDLQKYHTWLETRVAEKDRIRRLVGNDLRKLSKRHQAETSLIQAFQPQYLAYSGLVNAVVPLIMFKLVFGILNRLIFLSVTVAIGALVQDRMRTKIGKDELTCTLLCICISAFAAICL